MIAAMDLRPPSVDDGGAMWRLASTAGGLDTNSSYAYLLWCRDFAETSVVAVDPQPSDGELAGFITGYRRPEAPDVLFVWQVAVAPSRRRSGVAAAMLDHLADILVDRGGSWVEATVTPENGASAALFASFAARHGVGLEQSPLFSVRQFPDHHEPESLLRIGPFRG